MNIRLKQQNFIVEGDLATVIEYARRIKFTGHIEIPFNQGGAGTPLVLVEKIDARNIPNGVRAPHVGAGDHRPASTAFRRSG